MSPRGQLQLGLWWGRLLTLCLNYLGVMHGVGLLNIQGSVSFFVYHICMCPRFTWTPHVSIFVLLVCHLDGFPSCVCQPWYQRGMDHCHSEKNCTWGINCHLSALTKIFQHPCDTFLASLGGLNITPSKRSGLAALGCDSSRLPQNC